MHTCTICGDYLRSTGPMDGPVCTICRHRTTVADRWGHRPHKPGLFDGA